MSEALNPFETLQTELPELFKNLPFTAAHTYIPYVWEYPLGTYITTLLAPVLALVLVSVSIIAFRNLPYVALHVTSLSWSMKLVDFKRLFSA